MLLRLGPFDSGQASAVRIDAHAIEPYRANVTRVAADARDLVADGATVVLTTEGAGRPSGWSRSCARRA